MTRCSNILKKQRMAWSWAVVVGLFLIVAGHAPIVPVIAGCLLAVGFSRLTRLAPPDGEIPGSGSLEIFRGATRTMKTLMSRTDAIEGVVDEAMNSEIMGRHPMEHAAMTSSARLPSDPSGSIAPEPPAVVMLSGRNFMFGCAVVAGMVLLVGRVAVLPTWMLAAEVLATILGLFLFGSFKYQIHKNALTYGMLLIVVSTFCGLQTSEWHLEIAQRGWWYWTQHHLLSFRGLDDLVHADTMLFILGLTFFVSVIAQTRLLEGLTFSLLRRNQGKILSTVIAVTAVVALASGVLDGVSMIGLTIRTLVIILLLAAAPIADIRHAVMVCTTVTTVCGIWLAYGEPPNLIMKANLYPQLGNAFFLIYCAPIAIACYLVVARHVRKRLRGRQVDLDTMDVIDANAEDVRFLQATRHSEVVTPVELIEDHAAELGGRAELVLQRLRGGDSLGLALVRERVPEAVRKRLLGHLVSEDLADSLDRHYILDAAGDHEGALAAERTVDETLASLAHVRRRAQKIGALALLPFVGLPGAARLPPRNAALPGVFRRFRGCGAWHCHDSEDARSCAARCPARIRRVLLSLSPVSIDHASDQRGILQPAAGPDPLRDRDSGPGPRGVRAIYRLHVSLGHSR